MLTCYGYHRQKRCWRPETITRRTPGRCHRPLRSTFHFRISNAYRQPPLVSQKTGILASIAGDGPAFPTDFGSNLKDFPLDFLPHPVNQPRCVAIKRRIKKAARDSYSATDIGAKVGNRFKDVDLLEKRQGLPENLGSKGRRMAFVYSVNRGKLIIMQAPRIRI